MLMEKLRSGYFVKLIMVFVVLAFIGTILFTWGMDVGTKKANSMSVAKVGDEEIPFKNFNSELRNRYESARRQGKTLSSFDMVKIRNNLLEQFIGQTIVKKEIQDMELKASSEELINYFRSNPPQGIVQNPYFFKEDSTFDTLKYYQFLDSPETYNIPGMMYLEQYASEFTIPSFQLQSIISQSTKITNFDAKRRIIEKKQVADIEYLYFPLSSLILENKDSITVSEQEINKYYHDNPDSFKTQGMCNLEYIMIPKTPSDEDEKTAKQEIEDIYKKIKSNKEIFEEIAYELSEDYSTAKDSGNLGYISKGYMVKPFEDAAFSLKEGQISKPVKTRFGYHLIKVYDINKNEEKIKAGHILIRIEPSFDRLERLKAEADSIKNLLINKNANLDEIAKEKNLLYRTTGYFEKNGMIPNFNNPSNYISGLKNFVFNTKDNAEFFENDENLFVFNVIDRINKENSTVKPFKRKIKTKLLYKKQLEFAQKEMEKIYQDIMNNKLELKNAAKKYEFAEYTFKENITRLDYLPNAGSKSKLAYKVFNLEKSQITEPVKIGKQEFVKGFAIAKLLDKSKIDDKVIKSNIASVKKEMMEEKMYEVYNKWFEHKKDKIDIENNMSTFYAE